MNVMKMKRFAIGWLGALMIACTPMAPLAPEEEGLDRPLVEVALDLSVAPVDADATGTKADFDPDEAGYDKDAAIATLAVLQFEWQDANTASTAKLINQQYVQSYDASASKLPLVSSDTKNIIVVVANVPGKLPVPLGTPFSLFLKSYNYSLLTSLSDEQGGGPWYRPVGSEHRYLRLNGSDVVDAVTDGTIAVSMVLKRSCAKVVIKVTNKTATSGVTVEKVQLQDINRKQLVLTNLSSKIRDKVGEDYTQLAFQDAFDIDQPQRFDNVEETFTAENNASGTTQIFTYFVPANLRGTQDQVVAGDPTHPDNCQYRKNWLAPAGATYFSILAKDTDNKDVIYTYYLGRNLTTDYNLEPNRKYVYNFTITSRGDAAKDSRIEDFSEKTFDIDANCYMMRPPSRDGQSRVYAFPVRRAEVFWNKAGTGQGVYGAAADNTSTLQEMYAVYDDTEWTAEVIWQQIENYTSDDDFLLNPTKRTDADVINITLPVTDGGGEKKVVVGKGFKPGVAGSQPYIRIAVKAGMRGSALVAVRKKSDPTDRQILWSWHIWVTDYEPDTPVVKQNGVYIYSVPGGSVQRYNNSFWNSGSFVNAFAMDRNLGAKSYIGSGFGIGVNDSYGYLYSWGRKDPFRNVTSRAEKTSETLGGSPYWLIRTSVHRPTLLIIGSGWVGWTNTDATGNDNMGDKSKKWFDPKVDSHSLDGDHCEAGKSIYDPCPPGWQVPPVTSGQTGNANGHYYQGFSGSNWSYDGNRRGAYYYPAGAAAVATTGYGFFPIQGSYFNSMASSMHNAEMGRYFSAYYVSAFNTSNAGGYLDTGTTNLGNVRCVKLNQ